MPKDYSRTRRVAEQLRRELSELIREEVKDPRLGAVTITDVRVSRDLGHAKVFVGFLGSDQRVADKLAVLNHAAGFLRRELGRRVKLRVVPLPHFEYDDALDRGPALDRLIDEAIEADRRRGGEGGTGQ